MKIFRLLLLATLLLCAVTAPAMAAMSARKIGSFDVAPPGSSQMEISRDGHFIAMLSIPGEKGSECAIFDRRTHETAVLPGSSRMEPLCFSRDGRRLWVWGLHLDESLPGLRLKVAQQPFIALYDIRRQRYVRVVTGLEDDWDVPSDSVLSSDGRSLLYVTSEGWLNRFDTRTGRIIGRHRIQQSSDGSPLSFKLSSDGSKFLRSVLDDDGNAQSAQIVSVRSGRVLRTLSLPRAASGTIVSSFSQAKFAPRGHQVAVFQSDTQQWVFFDGRTGRVQWKIGGPSQISEGSVDWLWSPDARLVGVSGPLGFELRDARTGRILEKSVALHTDELGSNSFIFSADSSKIYTFMENDTGFGSETEVWQWHLFPTRRQRRADERILRAQRRSETRFALSPRHIHESLIQAARRGDPKLVEQLLNRGAYIEARDERGQTPLVNALFGRSDETKPGHFLATAKLLIARGANVKKYSGELLAGASGKSDLLMKLLLEHGADVNGDATRYGTATALHAAAGFHELSSVRTLLKHGANPNAINEYGETPLMSLAKYVDPGFPLEPEVLQVARLLIEHGADVNAKNKGGMSVLQLTQDKRLRYFLKRKGAK